MVTKATKEEEFKRVFSMNSDMCLDLFMNTNPLHGNSMGYNQSSLLFDFHSPNNLE